MIRLSRMPLWISAVALPLINLLLAIVIAGAVILVIYGGQYEAGSLASDEYWQSPIKAATILFAGAFGDLRNVSYTLFYATDFIFAGLAVAVAAHGGLFNIGAEGQGYIAGLGVALVCLQLNFLPAWLVVPLAIITAAMFGAAWAFVPAFLQAKRGSHVVITTIMFNFIASSVMVYMLAHVLVVPGKMSPESARFPANATLPNFGDFARSMGFDAYKVPLNLSFVIALLCSVGVWRLVWHTRWGYALRTVGANVRAAVYAGISVDRVVIATLCLSGALAGLIAINEVMGAQHRLVLNFVAGAGFVGIAVALMGRNHPFGIFLASVLFGALYQGGVTLSLTMPEITRDLAVVIQGLIILFTGALEHMCRKPIENFFRLRQEASA